MITFEILLPAGAIAFYLYDSMLLLYANDLVFTQRGSKWTVAGGSDLRLAGRRIYLPNPLTPYAALFRVSWSPADRRSASERPEDLQHFERALSEMRVLVCVLLAILLGVLPTVSLLLGAGVAMLMIFALYYLLVLVLLGLVFRKRHDVGLGTKLFWLLALDVLACAPFAVNLVRKLSLRRSIAGDPLKFAGAQFDAGALGQLVTIVSARIDEDLQRDALEADRRQELENFLKVVKGMAPCP